MPSPERSCGDCSLCCKLPYVHELNKSIDTWCPHARPGRGGCSIYATRPTTCRAYVCGWLAGVGGDEWFPARCKMTLTDNAQGHLVTVDPAFPNAWRREPYYSQILAWANKREHKDECFRSELAGGAFRRDRTDQSRRSSERRLGSRVERSRPSPSVGADPRPLLECPALPRRRALGRSPGLCFWGRRACLESTTGHKPDTDVAAIP
jgi:hypothetical protein